MEKRNIQISLEEAREWYNSGDSFKKELALKAYKKEELVRVTYGQIMTAINYNELIINDKKINAYRKLLEVATYFNNIYPKECNSRLHTQIYYIITKKNISVLFSKYKGFSINKSVDKSEYDIAFNSEEAAKQAIDILGSELDVLFE